MALVHTICQLWLHHAVQHQCRKVNGLLLYTQNQRFWDNHKTIQVSDFPFSLALHPIWQTRCTLMAADCSIKAIVHAILMESTSNSEMRKSFGPVAPYHPMSSTMNELMIFISLHDLLKKSSGTNLNLSQTNDSPKKNNRLLPSLSVHPATGF